MTAPVFAFRRMRRPQDKPATWHERLEALRYLPELVKLVWRTHRVYTTVMIALRFARSLIPLGGLWIGKLIIDEVVRSLTHPPNYRRIWSLVALEMAIVVLGDLLARASSLVESLLGDLFTNRISVLIMEHAATLDLHQFEDPQFYDHLERARRGTTNRIGLLAQLVAMGQNVLTLLSLSAALIAFNAWLLLLLTIAVLPSFIGETHFAALAYSLLFRYTPERRELDYIRYVGASDENAKEVQMFGLAPWLIQRYRELSDRFYLENKRLAVKKSFVSASLAVLGTLGYYGAYVVIILRTVAGAISVGSLTFLASSFSRSRDLIQGLLLSASDIYEQSLYLKDLFVFLEMEPTIRSLPNARPVPVPVRDGFVFEDVGFKYPESDRWAVRHVSFALRPGERLALVGENGAGKTTLTKLLARLYDPTEGRILLDGVDLKDYDLASVRQAIGVIFQDFVRYDMRFDENVGVGQIEEVRDYLEAQRAMAKGLGPVDGNGADRVAGTMARGDATAGVTPVPNDADARIPHTIRTAAEKSLAATLLPRLPGGYGQMLGRRFDGGVDLSGGEWQKVALGRAYMRDSQVLILDEPTAALDARAEYEVFLRFSELIAGRMAVLISHRFSTVRMADRIVVLRNGEVEEEGTHDALVAKGGLYAELFQMQAAGYR